MREMWKWCDGGEVQVPRWTMTLLRQVCLEPRLVSFMTSAMGGCAWSV